MRIGDLDSLFEPASVAVFGASLRVGGVGATVLNHNERMLTLARAPGFEEDQLKPGDDGTKAIFLALT